MKIKHRHLLTKNDFAQLERGKFYGIFAEPGSGKSHMMKTGLIQYCEETYKTVLMLTHRDTLKQQTKADLEEDIKRWESEFRGGGIVVMNYQAIEAAYIYNLAHKVLPLMDADFVVCDEAHYMVKDSWNEQTDYTAQFLEEFQGVKILMTGTPKEINVLTKMWDIERLAEVNRENNNLVAIRIYEKNSDLIEHINQYANDNCKVLSFISGKTERVLALKNENGGSFISSKHNDLYEEADKELIDIVIQGENAETQGVLPTNKLWSTSVWNEGINIIDTKLKAVCSFQPRSSTEFIQQFARARRSDIIGCIVAPTKKMLIGHKQKCEDNLAEIYAIRHKNGNPKFAKMSELYFLESIRETEEILEIGFGAYVTSVYKFSVVVENYGQVVRDNKIANYLETLVDKKMFELEQKQFEQTMIEEYGYRDNRGRKTLGPKLFNKFLQDGGIQYELTSKKERSKKSDFCGLTYWMIKKRTKNEDNPIYSKDLKNSTLFESKEPDFEKQLNAFLFNDNSTEEDAVALLIAKNKNKKEKLLPC